MSNKVDWYYIRMPLVYLLLALLASSALLTYTSWQEATVESSHQTIERNYQSARQKAEEADRNRTLYERYLEDYTAYLQKGLIGEEQRLNWIEELQAIDSNVGLISMRYEILPQADEAPIGVNVKSKNIDIKQTTMKLSMGLLHEGDFFRLLSLLRKNADGFYRLENCVLDKNNRGQFRFNPGTGNLEAECELDWYTVKIRGGAS